MKREFAVITGGSSYIANQVLPLLNLNVNKVLFVVRKGSVNKLPKIKYESEIIEVEDFRSISFENARKRILDFASSEMLFINFVGSLGPVSNPEAISLDDFYLTLSNNLDPFMLTFEIFSKCEAGSLYITFSGAGIGGDNLDDISLGYLCAKSAMVTLVEVLQNRISGSKNYICAIAPGPFPSEMQTSLLNSELKIYLSDTRVTEIRKLIELGGSTEKLVSAIEFAINNPDLVGGKVISARHDDFKSITSTKNFGKMRRVIE